MDPSSIITQVNRDEENFRNDEDNNNTAGPRLNKPRSLLRSLLCCFGARRSSSSSTPQSRRRTSQNSNIANREHTTGVCVSDGVCGTPIAPPPPSDTNGHALGTINGGGGLTAGLGGSLLPPVLHQDMGKICIVIDLDETLVHSSFKPISNADFIVPVEIDGSIHQVYVLKRPHVDHFLQQVGRLFECVLFTASLAKYADPVADLLDKHRVFRSRLFRESCVYYRGNYVKDLRRLGRNVRRVVIVDNSPASYIFHPDNAVAVKSWFDDMSDTELLDCLPLLERISRCQDVYTGLGTVCDSDSTVIARADSITVS